jgi:hypothetical protein
MPTLREREAAAESLAAARSAARALAQTAAASKRAGPISERGDAKIRWAPADEFVRSSWASSSQFGHARPGRVWRAVSVVAHAYRNTSRASGRVLTLAARNLLERGNLAMLGMAVTGVVGCGIQEGLLLADPAAPQHDAMRFACHYALENVLPSVTWSTKPAHLVAAAHSLPMDVLSPAAAGDASAAGVEPEAAARALAAHGWRSGRSIIAGYVCIAQVLRLVQHSASVRAVETPLFAVRFSCEKRSFCRDRLGVPNAYGNAEQTGWCIRFYTGRQAAQAPGDARA